MTIKLDQVGPWDGSGGASGGRWSHKGECSVKEPGKGCQALTSWP